MAKMVNETIIGEANVHLNARYWRLSVQFYLKQYNTMHITAVNSI